jgi:Arc/MetJ-type ribon-helix-helix transcriptional regulator
MKKHPNAPETTLITVTITKPQREMLIDMITKGNALNQSDAVRQSIVARNKQLNPYYKEKEERKESDKARIASMTNEEYLKDEFADYNFEIKGDKVIFRHGTMPDSPLQADVEIALIKNFDSENQNLAFARKE